MTKRPAHPTEVMMNRRFSRGMGFPPNGTGPCGTQTMERGWTGRLRTTGGNGMMGSDDGEYGSGGSRAWLRNRARRRCQSESVITLHQMTKKVGGPFQHSGSVVPKRYVSQVQWPTPSPPPLLHGGEGKGEGNALADHNNELPGRQTTTNLRPGSPARPPAAGQRLLPTTGRFDS